MNALLRTALVIAASAWGAAATSHAQTASTDWPSKPIRMVVTFPPGGSTDAVVRLLVPRLTEKLGQPVVVDNRTGAGGNSGLAIVANAAPDGYTLGVGAAGTLAANSPVPSRAGKTATPTCPAPTAGGLHPSRRTASTRFTWSPSSWSTPQNCPVSRC